MISQVPEDGSWLQPIEGDETMVLDQKHVHGEGDFVTVREGCNIAGEVKVAKLPGVPTRP